MDIDLHGHEGLIFWDFNDDSISYLERVTIPEEPVAAQKMADDMSLEADEVHPEPIHMRWVASVGIAEEVPSHHDLEFPCWVVCSELDGGAVPFWREPAHRTGAGYSEKAR